MRNLFIGLLYSIILNLINIVYSHECIYLNIPKILKFEIVSIPTTIFVFFLYFMLILLLLFTGSSNFQQDEIAPAPALKSKRFGEKYLDYNGK